MEVFKLIVKEKYQ